MVPENTCLRSAQLPKNLREVFVSSVVQKIITIKIVQSSNINWRVVFTVGRRVILPDSAPIMRKGCSSRVGVVSDVVRYVMR